MAGWTGPEGSFGSGRTPLALKKEQKRRGVKFLKHVGQRLGRMKGGKRMEKRWGRWRGMGARRHRVHATCVAAALRRQLSSLQNARGGKIVGRIPSSVPPSRAAVLGLPRLGVSLLISFGHWRLYSRHGKVVLLARTVLQKNLINIFFFTSKISVMSAEPTIYPGKWLQLFAVRTRLNWFGQHYRVEPWFCI